MDQTHIVDIPIGNSLRKMLMPKREYIKPLGFSGNGAGPLKVHHPGGLKKRRIRPYCLSSDSFSPQSYYIDLFNQGTVPFEYRVNTTVPWIKLSRPKNKIEKQERLFVSVNWEAAPAGDHKIPINIIGPSDKAITVFALIKNHGSSKKDRFRGFTGNKWLCFHGSQSFYECS